MLKRKLPGIIEPPNSTAPLWTNKRCQEPLTCCRPISGLFLYKRFLTPLTPPPATGYFQAYPYEHGGGFIRLEGDAAPDLYLWSLQAMTDYGYDFDSTQRTGLRLHLDTTRRIGFDSEWAWYQESLPDGSSANLMAGDFNLIYRFAQSHHAQWWVGPGFNWLEHPRGQDWGYNLAYGTDVSLGNPWIVSGSLDFGKQGSRTFFHGRATIGAQWRAVEAFVGYDFINASDIKIDSTLLGMRIWF